MTCIHSILFWFHTPRIEGNLLLFERFVLLLEFIYSKQGVRIQFEQIYINQPGNKPGGSGTNHPLLPFSLLLALTSKWRYNSTEFPNNSLWFAVSEIKEGFKGNGQDNLLLPMMEAGGLELMKCTLPSEPSW